MQTAAVILAAGSASRFGSPKQLARIGGRTMLEMAVDVAREAGLHPIIAVVPPGMAVPSEVVPEINDAPAEGLSRSLRQGLAAVPTEADAAVILLGDQPTLLPATIRAVLSAGRADRPVVAAKADGHVGPPVLLRREAFRLADAATGDEGLRSILLGHPDLVTPIEVGKHAPDVDTPDDLAALGESCPGCGALFELLPGGPTHEYIGSSAACWAAFGDLTAREFQDRTYRWIHRHTVDVYAAQHPGDDGRRQRQSVAVHLIGLCHWLEHDLTANQLTPLTQALTTEKRLWPWLAPPPSYLLTVVDALEATDGESHDRLVRAWAESVWQAWSPHHLLLRAWAADALSERR